MIEIEFNAYGETHKARFEKSEYANNRNLYVGVATWDEEYQYWEPWCDLTVNLDIPLDGDAAFLDTNGCTPEIINALTDKGYVINTGMTRSSGFCTYPLVRFTKEFLDGTYGEN